MRLLIAAGLVLAAAGPESAAQAQRTEVEDQATRRLRYLYEERAFPSAEIPAGALAVAKQQVEARFGLARRGAVANATRLDGFGWTPIGPGNIDGLHAGRVTALAIHPINRQTIYAGAAQGGVWKSIDGGTTWVPLMDRECSLAVGSIALDPVNPEIIYVGTGEHNNSADSYYGCGVLRSTNGGATWSQTGTMSGFGTSFSARPRIGAIVVDPTTAGGSSATVLAATSGGIYRSTNSGTTWTRVITGKVTALVLDPSNPRTAYMAIGHTSGSAVSANGIYKSTDGGSNWSKLEVFFGEGTPGRIDLAIAPSAPSTIYAAVEDRTPGSSNHSGLLGIWRTTSGGLTWQQQLNGITNQFCARQCWYNIVVAVDPTNADRVYFGGLNIYRSENAAVTFTSISSSPGHVDQHAFAFDPLLPTTLYAGNDGGVYRTTNATASGPAWATLNSNMAITQFYAGISLHPTDPATVLGGTQDNGTLSYSGIPRWRTVLGSDGGFTAINYGNPSIAWAETQWTPDFDFTWGPRRRTTPTGSFSACRTGIDKNDDAEFIPPLAMDPQVPRMLYFGTQRLYRTVDDGCGWIAILQGVNRTSASQPATVTAIASAPSDTSVIYVGSDDGNVLVSTDFGATWNSRVTGLPARVVKDFAIDPTDPLKAYVVLSGFTSNNGAHVLRTTNGGVNWTDVSGTGAGRLPDVPVNAIVIIPATNELVIGTDLGIFHSGDGGTSWVPLMEGFPNVAVFDLAYNEHTKLLVAATHGRGMFQYSMAAAVLRGDANGDGRVTAADAQLVLAAVVGLPLPPGAAPQIRGDANCDGLLNASDAQLILSHVVGAPLPPQACVGTVR